MQLIKEKNKYWIRNSKRLIQHGGTLENLTLRDLKKLSEIIEIELLESKWRELKKGQRLVVGNLFPIIPKC